MGKLHYVKQNYYYHFSNCLKISYFQKNYFRVCGKNDQENLPNNLESFENEISIFFRSSLKDSGRGLNCSYRVIEKELKPAKLYNGEGNLYLLNIYILMHILLFFV